MKKRICYCLSLFFLLACSGTAPKNLGYPEGKLTPCPDTPNCTSSYQENKPDFYLPPKPFIELSSAREKIMEKIATLPRHKIIKQDDYYIYFTQTSLIFRFVDDVEIYFDQDNKLIHFRSASRVGRSDFGVNKKRLQEILDF